MNESNDINLNLSLFIIEKSLELLQTPEKRSFVNCSQSFFLFVVFKERNFFFRDHILTQKIGIKWEVIFFFSTSKKPPHFL
jgi:hypothetical protein